MAITDENENDTADTSADTDADADDDDDAYADGHSVSALVRGSIVVVAKCPIPGKSKTRLIPLLGQEGSVRLAKSMLSDVLKTIDGCKELNAVRKILLYAPGTSEGLERMEVLLAELGLETTTERSTTTVDGGQPNNAWWLLPMATSSTTNDLRSNDLGAKLEDALVRVRAIAENEAKQNQTQQQQQQQQDGDGGVVFVGMDAPILPLDDVVGGLHRAAASVATAAAAATSTATLSPAWDGGYAMLCVPQNADPSKTFSRMHWSHPLTGMSQIKALTDQGIAVSVGAVVRDVDEADDVRELCGVLAGQSLSSSSSSSTVETSTKNLDVPSGGWPRDRALGGTVTTNVAVAVTSFHPVCYYTRRTLREAGLLEEEPVGEHESNE